MADSFHNQVIISFHTDYVEYMGHWLPLGKFALTLSCKYEVIIENTNICFLKNIYSIKGAIIRSRALEDSPYYSHANQYGLVLGVKW